MKYQKYKNKILKVREVFRGLTVIPLRRDQEKQKIVKRMWGVKC